MAAPTHKLADTGVRNAKPGPKPVKLFDGESMSRSSRHNSRTR